MPHHLSTLPPFSLSKYIIENPLVYELNLSDETGNAEYLYSKQSRRIDTLEISSLLCLDGVAPLREVCCLLQSTGSLLLLFAISECTADGTGLFGAEILGQVFAVLQKFTGSLTLGLVVHSEDASNRFAHLLDLDKLRGGTAGHLGNTQLSKL